MTEKVMQNYISKTGTVVNTKNQSRIVRQELQGISEILFIRRSDSAYEIVEGPRPDSPLRQRVQATHCPRIGSNARPFSGAGPPVRKVSSSLVPGGMGISHAKQLEMFAGSGDAPSHVDRSDDPMISPQARRAL